MKKIFTLIAVAAMAISANAQLLQYAGTETAANCTLSQDGFSVQAVSDKSNCAIDANSQYFGTATDYINFTKRWKPAGKGGSTVYIKITTPTAGKLTIYTRSASSSATDRALVVSQNGTELYNQIVKENETTDYETVTIEGEPKKVFPARTITVSSGTVDVTWTTNALNFYAYKFESTTGIQTVKTVTADGETYNLAGQKVNENHKGIVIKDGKKYMNK